MVVNVTKDAEGNYKALESLEMCRAIWYAGKVYHNRLAQECRMPGYKLTEHRDEKGNIVWKDIDGVPEEVMELFSKRRHQIEEQEAKFIEEHGRKPGWKSNIRMRWKPLRNNVVRRNGLSVSERHRLQDRTPARMP
ncbi:MAG: relaxase domain-containing protein [Victivallales bacterium]|nr:relaxase domain-containing protein [Victivallales bacterium]